MFKEWQSLGWKTISVNCIIIIRRKQGLSHCLQGARNRVGRCSESAEHYCCCHQLRRKWYSSKHYKFNLLYYVPIIASKPYICFLKKKYFFEKLQKQLPILPLVVKPLLSLELPSLPSRVSMCLHQHILKSLCLYVQKN